MEFIERKICIGWITSTEYINLVYPFTNTEILESGTIGKVIRWCKEFFDKYQKCPGKDIEGIYTANIKKLSKDEAEWIEEILENLSEEYEAQNFDSKYLADETKKHFLERRLLTLSEDIQYEIESGNLNQAEKILNEYEIVLLEEDTSLDPFSENVKSKIKEAFQERGKPLVRFPKALGQFWDAELIRGGFVALMGAEKIGKTLMLIEISMRALRSGSNVAFFQAGDMTELQQLRRMAIYLAGRSDQERYCRPLWVPTTDCIFNQTDECEEDCREGNAKFFKARKEINFESLSITAKENPEHKTCYNCKHFSGTPWLKLKPSTQVLTWPQAYKSLRVFGKKVKGKFKLSTHANESLTVSRIKTILKNWRTREEFIPDVIIVDYADILAPDSDILKADFRQQTGKTWQRLRNLSQEENSLVITVTQIKAAGYGKKLLTMSDFSEDKRKFAHVTALYGLNQDPDEKRIGMMRINELVIRESDFDSQNPVTILQRIQMGRPLLGSWK